MATAITERPTDPRRPSGHYRAYTPRPFTRAERDSVTVLFGGLHWRVERILQAVLESAGHKAQVLPVATLAISERLVELAPIATVNTASIMAGSARAAMVISRLLPRPPNELPVVVMAMPGLRQWSWMKGATSAAR